MITLIFSSWVRRTSLLWENKVQFCEDGLMSLRIPLGFGRYVKLDTNKLRRMSDEISIIQGFN